MKILYHHRIRSKDGQFVHIEEMVGALRARGHEVVLVGPEAVAQEDFGADAGIVATLKRALPGAVYEALEYGYAWHAWRRLEAAYRLHRPDVLYERYNIFSPAGLWLKRKYGLPFLLEVNAPLTEERAAYGGLRLKGLANRTDRQVWRGADRVLVVTDVLGDRIRAAGVPDERIVVTPNGIDLDRFAVDPDVEAAKARLSLGGQTVLGFTGFMREWHRLERVLPALKCDVRLRFFAVGDGPGRAPLEQAAATAGLGDRVRVSGIVPRDQVAAHVAAFDIALQPAVVAYASPLKLFEYMGLAKAIIAPDTRNIREILTDGADALLVDDRDDAAFQAAVLKLAGDSDLRDRLGRAARQTIREKGLTWARNAERVETQFNALLADKPDR